MCVDYCVVFPHTVHLFSGLVCVSIVVLFICTLSTCFWVLYVCVDCVSALCRPAFRSCMCVVYCIVYPHTVDLLSGLACASLPAYSSVLYVKLFFVNVLYLTDQFVLFSVWVVNVFIFIITDFKTKKN